MPRKIIHISDTFIRSVKSEHIANLWIYISWI